MKVKTQRRKKRKHNPAQSRKPTTSRRRRHNPAPSHRAYRRRRRHNPSGGGIKEFLIGAGIAGGGMIGATYLNNFAAKWLPVKARGAAAVGVGLGIALFFGRNSMAKTAAISIGGTGLFDLLRQNLPALVPMSAEDAGYLLGSAASSDEELASMFGMSNSEVPGVLPNVFGSGNSEVPGVLPNVFGVDTAMVPMGYDSEMFGVDTAMVPMGDEEGESLFGESYL